MARLCQLSLYNNVTFIYLCFESECLLINRKYLRQNTHLLFSMFAYIKQFRLIIYFALKCFIFQSPQIESFAFYNDQIVPTQPVINNGNAHSKGIYSYSIILENRLFSPFTKVYCVIKHVYLVYIVQVQQLLIIVLDSGWFRVYRIFQRPCRINISIKLMEQNMDKLSCVSQLIDQLKQQYVRLLLWNHLNSQWFIFCVILTSQTPQPLTKKNERVSYHNEIENRQNFIPTNKQITHNLRKSTLHYFKSFHSIFFFILHNKHVSLLYLSLLDLFTFFIVVDLFLFDFICFSFRKRFQDNKSLDI